MGKHFHEIGRGRIVKCNEYNLCERVDIQAKSSYDELNDNSYQLEGMRMTLLYSKPGEEMVVDEITWSPGVKRRLEDMGFIKGTPVRVIRSDGFGAIVVEIKGSKLLLGRGMAQKIKVKQAA